LYLALLAGLIVFVWLLIHRFRVAFLAERAADSGLEHAIEQRRVEGATS